MAERAFVVAVSGTSGAGKTTVIDGLVESLAGAARLHFDDFITLGNDIGEIAAWLAGGADPDRIATPHMADAVRRLASDGHAAFVVVEEPFGRARAELAPLIDLAVHIDLPLDIAIGRRILRAIASPGPDLIADIEGQMRAFIAGGRDAYLAIDRSARGTADLIVDGQLPAADLIALIRGAIATRTIDFKREKQAP